MCACYTSTHNTTVHPACHHTHFHQTPHPYTSTYIYIHMHERTYVHTHSLQTPTVAASCQPHEDTVGWGNGSSQRGRWLTALIFMETITIVVFPVSLGNGRGLTWSHTWLSSRRQLWLTHVPPCEHSGVTDKGLPAHRAVMQHATSHLSEML